MEDVPTPIAKPVALRRIPTLLGGPAAGARVPEDAWGSAWLHYLAPTEEDRENWLRGTSFEQDAPEGHPYTRVEYRPIGSSEPIVAFVHRDDARGTYGGLELVFQWLLDRAFAEGPRLGLATDLAEAARRQMGANRSRAVGHSKADRRVFDEAAEALRRCRTQGSFQGSANL